MAEYAGLEIRIGGDTTKLNKALRASVGAAAELQREIRQITMAMQFDPSNLKNVSTRIKLTSDRMEALRSKVQLAETAMEQLGDKVVKIDGKDKTIKELAEETKNVALTAKMADERYNDMVATIATLYEQFNKVSKNAAIKELAEKVGGVQEAMRLAKLDTEEFDAAMERLDVPADVVERFKYLSNTQFHFEGRTGELDKMLEKMQQLGVFTTSDVEQVKQLRSQFEVIASDKAAYDMADQFQELGVRIARDKAEIEGLSTTIRELDTHSKVSMGDDFIGTKKHIEDIDRAIKALDEDMKRANAALDLDPKNLGAAIRAYDDLAQKADLLRQRGEELRANFGRLDTPEVKQAAKEHKNLAEWVENARSAAQRARSTYSDQAAELKNLETAAKRTNDSIELLQSKMSAYERGLAGHEAYEKAKNDLKEAKDALDDFKKSWNPNYAKPELYLDEYRKLSDDALDATVALEQFKAANKKVIEAGTGTEGFNYRFDTLKERAKGATDALEAFEKKWGTLDDDDSMIKLAQDISDASAKVEQLEDNFKTLKDVKIADKGDYKKWQQDLDKLQDEYKELTTEVDRCNAEVDESREAMNRANGELDLANQTQEWQKLTGEIDENTAAVKENAEALKGANSGGGILTASNLKSWGMTLYSTVTPAISSIGYAMISASEDIDSAYRDMRKTVDGTEQDFQRLYDAAIEFSNTHVTSAAQLLEIEAIGGELGIATENLQEFGEVVASLADSTNLSAEDAATALGHLANIMKIEPDQYSGFADALVRLGNNGASTEEEIVNIAERIGSMGSIVGMSTSDVLAWASTIAATGQNAEAAGTAISKTMSFMETAVAAAGGTMEVTMDSISAAVAEGGSQLTIFASMSDMTADQFVEAWSNNPEEVFESLSEGVASARDSLQKIADVAGMSADEFARAWESDPTVALEAFIKGLNSIEESGGSADATLGNLGITAVRQKQAIEGLMQTVGHLDDNLTMSEDAWNGQSDAWGKAGDAANEAAKKAEGFSGQLQILKNMAQGALASLGEGAVPIMKTVSTALSDLTKWFESLSTEAKTAAIKTGAFLLALGPGLTIISTFMTSWKSIKGWFAESNSAIALVARAARVDGQSMVDSLMGVNGAAKATTATVATLRAGIKGIALSLGKGIIAGAIIYGISQLVTEFIKLRQEAETSKRATEGLKAALDGVAQVNGYFADSMDGPARSVKELCDEVDRLTERQAELADSIAEANTEYSNTMGAVEYYAHTVEDLAAKSDRSEAETAKLKAAISGLNEECGTSYGLNDYGELIDIQTGKVVDNTEAIWDNVEARRAQAIVDYYSGSYDEAVAQMQQWKDALVEAQEKRNELMQSPFYGRDLMDIDESDLDEFREWNSQWSANEQVINEAATNYRNARDAVDELEQKIGEATDTIDANKRAQEEAATAAEAAARRQEIVADDVTGNMRRMSDAVDDDVAFAKMADSLDMLTVSANELDGVDMSRFASSFDGSMADVMAALEDGGVYLTTFRTAMENAGVSSEMLSSMTATAFQSLYESCGGSIDKTADALTHMQTVMTTVDGQQVTFYVGDNGTIMDSQGKIYDLDHDIADIPDDVLVKYFGDNTDALNKARAAKEEAKSVDRTTGTITIKATDYASSVIEKISRKLSGLGGKNIPIGAGSSATGSIGSSPYIPRHAKGYIATGPTLTNQGWIGEDGIEAVSNWATGGAVVPLTNTKYMLPIADAIAEGMANRGAGMGGATYNLYINDARVNDNPAIESAFVGFMNTLVREGAMNVGNR